MSDALGDLGGLGGLGTYERLLSSRLQNSRVFFSQNRFCRAPNADAIFLRKAREELFAVVVVFFSLSQVSLSVFTLIPDLPLDARARVGLNQSKNTSFLAVYLSREETLVS